MERISKLGGFLDAADKKKPPIGGQCINFSVIRSYSAFALNIRAPTVTLVRASIRIAPPLALLFW